MKKNKDKDEGSLNSLGALPNTKLSKQVKDVIKEGKKITFKDIKAFVVEGNKAITEMTKGKVIIQKVAKFESHLAGDKKSEFEGEVKKLINAMESVDKILQKVLDDA